MTSQTPPAAIPSGYRSPRYAEALAEFGTPRHLPESGGWILERDLPGGGGRDAMGCYPLFSCRDWSGLSGDLVHIGDDLVSLVLVADPFGDFELETLRRCFPDRMLAFKEHFTVDLSRPMDAVIGAHHRRNVRKALQAVSVERCPDPAALAETWTRLYSVLVERHGIRGISAFSPASFARQLAVPGLDMFVAQHGDEIVGMTLWYRQGDAGYYHLGAYSEQGYRLGASFAMFHHALHHFAGEGLREVDLGAGAGSSGDSADGLTRFKRGWATGTRTAWLCGRIFDHERYEALSGARGEVAAGGYFPAYRRGEFA